MGLRDMYSAGDIIEYEGGGRDYLVSIEGEEGLWVNACNPSWVERGLRGFCDECHPFFARVYGYCDGTVVEFCMGIACIVIATVSLYIAGMLRDRRIQAEFDRRRAERERRRAERKNRGW